MLPIGDSSKSIATVIFFPLLAKKKLLRESVFLSDSKIHVVDKNNAANCNLKI